MAANWVVPGYRHVRELGTGSTGRVSLAVEIASGSQVAIKHLDKRLVVDREFRSRFRAVARLIAELNDGNVARFHRYEEWRHGAAIVLEFVDGVALSGVLRSAGQLPAQAALVMLKGSLQGLAAAHALGIIHQDYKPGNVLVDNDGGGKLVDFGIAARHHDHPAGTPAYMAPERWSAGTCTPATDVYAATAVFFECLAGRPPFTADDPIGLMREHATAAIPFDLVPGRVRELVAYGMARSPDDRPAAADFLRELERIAGDRYGELWEEQGRAMLAELTMLSRAAATTEAAARHVIAGPQVVSPRRVNLFKAHPVALTTTVGAILAAAALAFTQLGPSASPLAALPPFHGTAPSPYCSTSPGTPPSTAAAPSTARPAPGPSHTLAPTRATPAPTVVSPPSCATTRPTHGRDASRHDKIGDR